MKALIELCVRRPIGVIMVLAAVLISGVFSLSRLPLQKLPELDLPRVTVETLYPGMDAEDIRPVLTIPMEDALSSVKGLERMRSVSRDGASLTILDFHWGTDSGEASVLVREAIDAVYPGLPDGVSKPAVVPGDPGEEPQAVAAVSSPIGSAFARNLAEYEILPRLRRIEGVGRVILAGGETEEVKIETDLSRAVSRGLSPAAIAQALASETANIPAGNAREGDRELVVVSSGKPGSTGELAELVLPSGGGAFYLKDLGRVRLGPARPASIFVSADNGDASLKTALEIYRRPGADPVKLSRDIKRVLTEAEHDFSRDAEIVPVYDGASSIVKALKNLLFSACSGALAVMLVLFITLKRLRYGLLAGFSIFLSAAASFTALALGHRSLNSMSFSGIALGIGMVSDTAVIILDLLHRGFDGTIPSVSSLSAKAASVLSSSFGGTLTTAVVFIPILFFPGPLGALYGDLSLALVVSIAAGWAYAQFALPGLYRLFCTAIQPAKKSPKRTKIPKAFVLRLRCFFSYARLLRGFLRRPLAVFGVSAFLSVAGLLFLVSRPAGFISTDDAEEVELTLVFPPGTSLESMGPEAEKLAAKLSSLESIKVVFGSAGAEAEDSGKRSDPDYRKEVFRFRCLFASGSDPQETLESIKALMEDEDDPQWYAGFPRDKSEKLLGLSSSLSLALKAKDAGELEDRRLEIEALLAASEFAGGFSIRPSGSRPELRIVPDREASAFLGISAADTARAVYAAAEGLIAGELEVEGKALKMKVLAASGNPGSGGLSAEILEGIPVAQTEGGPVFLGSLARIERREADAVLARLDRNDTVYIDVFPKPGKKTELSRFLAALGRSIPGLSRADESAFSQYRWSLIITAALVLFLLYLTMGAEFESFTLPLVLMLTIPFSLAGAGPALYLCGAGLDSSSVLGILVLFGIAVNNGMILYERTAEKIGQGLSPAAAVYGAARERCRPVLTTALTTVCALFPLVLPLIGAGQRSMAAAMLGGISASVLLSLFALPPVFIRFSAGRVPGKKERTT
jgi:multidrug efflux pump subunit AcrB